MIDYVRDYELPENKSHWQDNEQEREFKEEEEECASHVANGIDIGEA
jgi:hypothetical protein